MDLDNLESYDALPSPVRAGTLPFDKITNRAKNKDGSISTVRTISFNDGQGEILIPTVIDNKVVSNDEAIKHYYSTGENFGTFKTVEDADRVADYIHTLHEQLLANEK